jgi:hypothetical protein
LPSVGSKEPEHVVTPTAIRMTEVIAGWGPAAGGGYSVVRGGEKFREGRVWQW